MATPRTPTLRVDTSHTERCVIDGGKNIVYPSPSSPRSPTVSRNRARSISQTVLPSFRISSVSSIANQMNDADTSAQKPASVPPGMNRARNESRKLLAHILSQLQGRPVPPSLLSTLVSGSTTNEKGSISVIRTVRGAVKYTGTLPARRTHQPLPQDDMDSDEEDAEAFSTDLTLDLINQLKDVLVLSIAHSWDIFYDSNVVQTQRSNSEKIRDSFRRRSLSVGRSPRSRSPSVGRGESDVVVRAPQLLSQCISILASVIAEDCRFKITSPRPSRPPNSLQFAVLDVARFLLHTHRHDPQVISQIGFAILPAFMTFSPDMHTRLLGFFDDSVLGNLLADLRSYQGTRQILSPSADVSYDGASNNEPPMVSILVDEVQEDLVAAHTDLKWRRWTRALPSEGHALRSTSAPLQDIAIYHLSSIIPPLLASVLENVDLSVADSSTLYRFHRLLSHIAESKPDAYLDCLAVVAYHTPRARYAAISLLLSYWPHAIGHLTISKPFPTINYHEAVARETSGALVARRHYAHPYSHQFVPWRFKVSGPSIFAGVSQNDCHSCANTIEGFGLLCPMCLCMVHFDCYDYSDGSFFTQYGVASDPSLQKVAVHKFSLVLPQRHTATPEVVHKEQHAFRPVNLFSLTLCFICRQPLWGPVLQALNCGSCKQFVHPTCLTKATPEDLPRCRSIVIDDTYMTIPWKVLRQSFADYYREVFLTEADLPNRTYEELSVFLSVLWTQLHILTNGLALGSIVVKQGARASEETHLDEFELHYLVNLYDVYLSSRSPSISQALSDHLTENQLRPADAHMFFNWNVLTFIISVVKSPPSSVDVSIFSTELLAPRVPGRDYDDDSGYPYEVVTLAHMRDQLGDQLNFQSEAAAKYLLSHLLHLGFFQRVDAQVVLFDGGPHPERLQCSFPIPIGLEVSTEVETLVASIEACLSEIDLSINEAGLLLLCRKFWPDGMLTDYALRRLSKVVLSWIIAEDDDLAMVLRDYVARGLSIPGVRSGVDIQPWPNATQSRPTPSSSANNGGDYVAGRRSLSSRYAARWLLALHDQDIAAYAVMVFDLLAELAQELPVSDEFFLGKRRDPVEKREAAITERILHLILKLSQVSVLYTAFDDLFQKWLDRASSLDIDQQMPIASLSRLFNREFDAGSHMRLSALSEARLSMTENQSLMAINPLKVIVDIATTSNEGYDRTLHWLCLFVRSGIEISVPTFMELVGLGNRFGISLEVCSLLIKAALWSCWLKSMGRQDLQTVVANIHAGISAHLVMYLQAHHRTDEVVQVIRQSLATCLLLYGCDRTFLVSAGLVLDSEIQGLPSRRKLHARASTVNDPIIVNATIVDALKSYVETGLQEVSCIAAKFLDAFMNHAALVETYEVDNFILRNGSALCTCVWHFYSVQTAQISTIRTGLLLRTLVVDAQPFQTLLESLFEIRSGWEVRLQAVVRLFRVIEDVTSPAFVVEDRQWRSSVVDIFKYFFAALWEDAREEVRLAVDTWTQTLQAAHFEAITLCWDEALAKSPIPDRTKLVSFLNQLRSHFPQWRLLSWDVLIEALLESEFIRNNGDDEDGPLSAHLSMYGLPSASRKTMFVDPGLQSLQNSLISLALRMIAEGIPIEVGQMLKLKDHLARTLGYAEVSMVPIGNTNHFFVQFGSLDVIPAAAYPCLDELMLALDSAQPYSLVSSTMGGRHSDDETAASLLVGSIFVDLFLETFIQCEDLEVLPPLTLKNLLKSLIIVIYKHDFDTRPLKMFQPQLRRAVKRALDLLLEQLSYDLRPLVLTACHAFIKRWPHLLGTFVSEAIESTISLMESNNHKQQGDDILIEQTKSFLRKILSFYAFSGVFYSLCKRRRTPEFFAIIKNIIGPTIKAEHTPHPNETLRDALLRDTLTRVVDGDDESLQVVIDNVNTYVEVVHHTDYSLSLMQFVGLSLANLTRRTADIHHGRFDPSPLLILSCNLIQHNKANSRDLLLYLETLLRSSLIRFNVSVASLRRVLHVTTTLYRRAAAKASNPQKALANPITSAMFEITRDSLNVKARVTHATLTALIEALTLTPDRGSAKMAFVPLESQLTLALDGLAYFYNESTSDGLIQSDFTTSQAVAKMIIQCAEFQPSLLANLAKNPVTVRVWNILALAALSKSSAVSAALLFEHFSTFTLVYTTSLLPYQTVLMLDSPDVQDRAHADISTAYTSIKLWLLLARKAASGQPNQDVSGVLQDGEGMAAKMVWNELWPPFETVLAAFDTETRSGHVSPVASSIWASVGDLFLFIRQSRSVIALDTAISARILERLKTFVRGESKVSRVLRSLRDAPPDSSLESFVSQLLTEITAEEKLQAAKRQINTERGRRVAS